MDIVSQSLSQNQNTVCHMFSVKINKLKLNFNVIHGLSLNYLLICENKEIRHGKTSWNAWQNIWAYSAAADQSESRVTDVISVIQNVIVISYNMHMYFHSKV